MGKLGAAAKSQIIPANGYPCTNALNHGGKELFWLDAFKIHGVTCCEGQKGHKGELAFAVAITERVNGVQFRKEMGAFPRELGSRQAAQPILGFQLTKDPRHFRAYVLGVAEHAAALGEANCAAWQQWAGLR
jgi:hypothetical protein